jgi:hypothetical protein
VSCVLRQQHCVSYDDLVKAQITLYRTRCEMGTPNRKQKYLTPHSNMPSFFVFLHNFHSHSLTNLPRELISPPLGRLSSERWTNSLMKLKCLGLCSYIFHIQLLKRVTDFHQTWLKVMPVQASTTLKTYISCTR